MRLGFPLLAVTRQPAKCYRTQAIRIESQEFNISHIFHTGDLNTRRNTSTLGGIEILPDCKTKKKLVLS